MWRQTRLADSFFWLCDGVQLFLLQQFIRIIAQQLCYMSACHLTVLRRDVSTYGVTLDCFVRNIYISSTPPFDRPLPSPHAPSTLFPAFFTPTAKASALEAQAEEERARSENLRASVDATAREASSAREALAEAKAGLSITKEALQQAQVRACVCSRGGVRPYFPGVFF